MTARIHSDPPLNPELKLKVTSDHLERNAYVYIRQSTMRQVSENTESKARQYALGARAVELGWSDDKVVTIDLDLGKSGASAQDREGFQKLMTEVSLGHAGMVLGLEVSRLARNNADWHRLLEICAMTGTLILDEDGIYDPTLFNDRLILGLKGTMSEVELFVMRGRLRGGLLNKARRGELRCSLPVGLVHGPDDVVEMDPDQQVQEVIRLFFETYTRTGSASATVKHFRTENILFPARLSYGHATGDVAWRPLSLSRAARTLHNPWYAGAYVYGRTRCKKQPDGRIETERLPPEKWTVFIKDAHPGYLSWEEYESNQKRLSDSARSLHFDRSPPREGPALLQGRIICGRCGSSMHVHYQSRAGRRNVVNYICKGRETRFGDPFCQSMLGTTIDAAIEKLLLDSISPMMLDLAMSVQNEISARIDQADHQRHLQVERAEYEVRCARERYMQVDPSNRLVAGKLESTWNDKLATLATVKLEYERQRDANKLVVGDEARARISALITNFPALWKAPSTPQRERKRMLGLLIEDVSLSKQQEITVNVRFRGGSTTTLTLPRSLTQQEMRATDPAVRDQIDVLLKEHTDAVVARIMNERGLRTGAGSPFNVTAVRWIRRSAKLPTFKKRLLKQGMLTRKEISARLGMSRDKIRKLRKEGALEGRICNELGEWLYWLPESNASRDIRHNRRFGSSEGQGAV